VLEQADTAVAERVRDGHDVGAVLGRHEVPGEVAGVLRVGGEHRLALAVHVHIGGIPELPAYVLRLPEGDHVTAVVTHARVGLVRVESSLAPADVEVDGPGLAGLHVDHEEELVPDAVLVHIVHLVLEEVAVRLLPFEVAARPGELFLGRLRLAREGGIDHGEVMVRDVGDRKHGRGDGDRNVLPGDVERVRKLELHPLRGREIALGVPPLSRSLGIPACCGEHERADEYKTFQLHAPSPSSCGGFSPVFRWCAIRRRTVTAVTWKRGHAPKCGVEIREKTFTHHSPSGHAPYFRELAFVSRIIYTLSPPKNNIFQRRVKKSVCDASRHSHQLPEYPRTGT